MTTANHLINALVAQDQEEADSAFESAIQERLADFLEVRKVELASTIMDDLQEARHTHQVVYTVPGEGKQKQYYHVTADDEDHAREQLMDAEPKAKIHKVEPITKNKPVGGFGVHEGAGMDAQRRWTRQVAAVIAADPKKDGKSRSMHRGELKARAREYFQQMGGVKGQGDQFVDRGAGFVRDARSNLKRQGKLPTLRKEESLNEVLSTGSASNAQLGKNVVANIRRATQALGLKGVNPNMAAQGHKDFAKLVAKNPRAPGYMLLRKLAPAKAAAVQSLTQAGVPLGSALDAHPSEFNQVVQKIKRFK